MPESSVRLDASRGDPFLNQNSASLISSNTSVLRFTASCAGATVDSAMGIASPDLEMSRTSKRRSPNHGPDLCNARAAQSVVQFRRRNSQTRRVTRAGVAATKCCGYWSHRMSKHETIDTETCQKGMTRLGTVEPVNPPRSEVGLAIQVSGIDTKGKTFLQDAHASNVSIGGALISQLDVEVRTGDVIALAYSGKKARYRVVWVRHGGVRYKYQAVVQRIDPDECPWQNLLSEEPGVVPSPEAPRAVVVSRAE
jgi:hypothetical protein